MLDIPSHSRFAVLSGGLHIHNGSTSAGVDLAVLVAGGAGFPVGLLTSVGPCRSSARTIQGETMISCKGLLVLLAGVALSFQAHATTYAFSGFFSEPLPPGQSDATATFLLSLADSVHSNTFVPAAAMSSCTTHVSPCVGVTFHVDAAADGLTPNSGVQAVELTTAAGFSGYYYFTAPAFTTSGSYASLYGFNSATLVVVVPEPSTYSQMLAGMAFAGALVLRRRRKVGCAANVER